MRRKTTANTVAVPGALPVHRSHYRTGPGIPQLAATDTATLCAAKTNPGMSPPDAAHPALQDGVAGIAPRGWPPGDRPCRPVRDRGSSAGASPRSSPGPIRTGVLPRPARLASRRSRRWDTVFVPSKPRPALTRAKAWPGPQPAVSVPQRAVDFAPGRLRRPLRRIQRVLHLLPGVIQALAGPFARSFLVAGGEPGQHQGTGSDQQRLAHETLFKSGDNPNGPDILRLHRSGNIRVGMT